MQFHMRTSTLAIVVLLATLSSFSIFRADEWERRDSRRGKNKIRARAVAIIN